MSSPLSVLRSPLVMFTPMPPARTGVAHYASMLVPALQKHVEVKVVTEHGERRTENGER